MAAGSTRSWSDDSGFLIDFSVLKRRFIDCDITQDLYGMVSSLKLLLYVTEPKLQAHNPKEEADKIKWLEQSLASTIFIDGQTGRQVETDGTRANKRILMDYSEEIFRSLLMKLQKAGIYTRNTRNIKDVLGDFSGS